MRAPTGNRHVCNVEYFNRKEKQKWIFTYFGKISYSVPS